MNKPTNMGTECPMCNGTGYIWSSEIPGLRKRCDNCDGSGSMERREHIRDRSYEMEGRCDDAVLILSTMTIVGALICCIGPWVPEQLLITAAITMGCSGIGVMGFGIIRMVNALERIASM